jgi:hypothetical protein
LKLVSLTLTNSLTSGIRVILTRLMLICSDTITSGTILAFTIRGHSQCRHLKLPNTTHRSNLTHTIRCHCWRNKFKLGQWIANSRTETCSSEVILRCCARSYSCLGLSGRESRLASDGVGEGLTDIGRHQIAML